MFICALWMVAAVGAFFVHDLYSAGIFAIVAGVTLAFCALPTMLLRITGAFRGATRTSFRDWEDEDLELGGAPIHGREAFVNLMIVPIAVASCMTLLGIVAVLDGLS
jgi:hypothetical protein